MTQTSEAPIVTRIRAIAQHELSHYVAAIALGFEGQEVTLKVHPTELVHRGKSRTNSVEECNDLAELREFIHRRAIVALAGVMGETVTRGTFQVDMRQAYQLLEDGETGAGNDNAVAKELAQLLANSAIESGNGGLPSRGAGSMKVFQALFTHAATVVQLNVKPICELADMLARRVKASEGDGLLEAFMTQAEMEHSEAFLSIQRVALSELTCQAD